MSTYYCECSAEAWSLQQAESPEAAAKAHAASGPYEPEARSVTVDVYAHGYFTGTGWLQRFTLPLVDGWYREAAPC